MTNRTEWEDLGGRTGRRRAAKARPYQFAPTSLSQAEEASV
jgi:hypothetical protein